MPARRGSPPPRTVARRLRRLATAAVALTTLPVLAPPAPAAATDTTDPTAGTAGADFTGTVPLPAGRRVHVVRTRGGGPDPRRAARARALSPVSAAPPAARPPLLPMLAA